MIMSRVVQKIALISKYVSIVNITIIVYLMGVTV